MKIQIASAAAFAMTMLLASTALAEDFSPYDVASATGVGSKWVNTKPGTFVLFHRVQKPATGPAKRATLVGYQLVQVTKDQLVFRKKVAKYESGKYVAAPAVAKKLARPVPPSVKPSNSWKQTLTIWGKPVACTAKQWSGDVLQKALTDPKFVNTQPGAVTVTTWESTSVPGGLVQTRVDVGTGTNRVATTSTLVHRGHQVLTRGFGFVTFSPYAWGDINGCHGPFCNSAIVDAPR